MFFAGGFIRAPEKLLSVGADLETRLGAIINECLAIHHIRIVGRPLLHPEFAGIEATAIRLEFTGYAYTTEKRRYRRCLLILSRLGNHIGRAERKITGVVEPTFGHGHIAIGLESSRDCLRRNASAYAQRTVRLRLAACKVDRQLFALKNETSVCLPRTCKTVCGDHGIESGSCMTAAACLFAKGNCSVTNGKPLQLDFRRIKRCRRADRPIDLAAFVQGNRGSRAIHAHIENQKLAAQKRHQFSIHRKRIDGHHWMSRIGSNTHIGESDRRKRQKPCADVTSDLDRAPQNTAGLALEIGTIAAPVNKRRHDKCSRQQQHEKPADDDEYAAQKPAPVKQIAS